MSQHKKPEPCKDRTKAELALMDELVPFLKKQAQGRDISGLAAYE